jgi:hypothetical protein
MFRGTPSPDLGKMFSLGPFLDGITDVDDRGTVELKICLKGRNPNSKFFGVADEGPFRSPDTTVFCRLASDVSQSLRCAQPVHETLDCDKARSWLDTCAGCHETACRPDSHHIPGMKLIDCENMVIVKAAQEMPWLALSYVWGVNYQTEDPAGYRAGSKLSLEIPGTIRDAIIVTLWLGYRFLWVDEYCIDQKDEIHRKDQIGRMDQIYRGADLTIVAAAGTNKMYGLPGVGSTKRAERKIVYVEDVVVFANVIKPHTEIRRSKWFTRAW